MTTPEPSSGAQSRFDDATDATAMRNRLRPTWLQWVGWTANGLATLAFLLVLPGLLGTLALWLAIRIMEIASRTASPPITWADAPIIYLVGFLMAPSVIFAVIGSVVLIQQTVKVVRRK